jgi:glycosyltransferase involved in cell wall biosynthesis
VKVTFVHTSSMLNLRGSEKWLIDVCKLLSDSAVSVRLVNFDYDQRYSRDRTERERRFRIVKEALGDTPWVRLSALRLNLPGKRTHLGKGLHRFVDDNLHFVPLSREFFRALRSSDLVYFLQCQPPAHLLVVLGASTLAGRKPVVAGIHVRPRIRPYQAVLLRIFTKIGVLKGVHLINQDYEVEMRRKVGCRMEYIPNGVYSEKYGSGMLSKDSRAFSILFVGAMTWKKGIDIVPEIYDRLNQRLPSFRLTICTPGGPMSEAIRGWSSSHSNVVFKGYVDDSELRQMYRESCLVLLPSRDEQFPLVPLEAQASGTPVVASDIGGFRQCVVEGKTGFLVSPYSPEAFATKIEKVYHLWSQDKSSYLRLCSEAKEYVKQNFEWRRVSGKLQRMLYNAAIA